VRLSWNVPIRWLTVHNEVSGKLPILRERQQAVRVAESKCLQRTSKGVRAARKGIGGLLPGAESRSSEVRVSDGMHEPIPEDSLHYCLLLGGGDTNDRGEDGEGSNTPVCRPRGVQKTSMRGPSSGWDRACAKTDPFSERGEAWLSHLVGGQGIAGSNPAVLTDKRFGM
jgi:hypothetical protein